MRPHCPSRAEMTARYNMIDLVINRHKLTNIGLADNWFARLRGLLSTKEHEFTGLLITKCSSVHTIGMRYPIDIVFIDKTKRVVKVEENVKPLRLCFGTSDTFSTLELPVGTIAKLNVVVGDVILKPSDADMQSGRVYS